MLPGRISSFRHKVDGWLKPLTKLGFTDCPQKKSWKESWKTLKPNPDPNPELLVTGDCCMRCPDRVSQEGAFKLLTGPDKRVRMVWLKLMTGHCCTDCPDSAT